MNEKELFLKSHEQLSALVKTWTTAIFTVPAELQMDLRKLENGCILLKEEMDNVETLTPATYEIRNLLFRTFCESHLRLKND